MQSDRFEQSFFEFNLYDLYLFYAGLYPEKSEIWQQCICILPFLHSRVVRELVTYEPLTVYAKDKLGCLALHCAAKNGHFDIVQFLIENGTPINAQ